MADDPGMHSSQNEQDSRHYAEAAKVPMLEPADSEEARVFAKRAYELSEKFNTPVFLKMCTRVAHSQSVVNTEERIVPEQVPYKKDPTKVMMTKNSRDAHVRVEQRTKDLIAFAENCDREAAWRWEIHPSDLSQAPHRISTQRKCMAIMQAI